MKNRSRSPSPPAAYAKYLNDFEECDEVQVASPKKRSFMERSCKPGFRNFLHDKLEYGRIFNAMPSTSRGKESYDLHAENKRFESRELSDYRYENYHESFMPRMLDSYQRSADIDINSCVATDRDTRRYTSVQMNYADSSSANQKSRNKLKKLKKICFAFAKFGDCHYGADCKFSHDPALLKPEEQFEKFSETKRPRSDMPKETEDPDATCRQLEQRLLEIQRELTLLEEESKKPKSSVIVPKRNKMAISSTSDTFGPSVKASINVGGDFIVRVGNSRRKVEENSQRVLDGNNISRSSNRRLSRKRSCSSSCDKELEQDIKGCDLLEVSDDDRESGRRTNVTKVHAVSKTLRTDQVSSSDSENKDSTKDSTNGSEFTTDLISNSSEGLLSLSEQGLSPTAELVSDAEICTDESQKDDFTEPIDFSSVVNPDSLVEISDDDLEDKDLIARRQPFSCREATSVPFVFRDCQLLHEQLPQRTTNRLMEFDLKSKVESTGARAVMELENSAATEIWTGVQQAEFLEFSSKNEIILNEGQVTRLITLEDEAKEVFLQ